MRGRFDARLNGESLLGISGDLYITDITENAAREQVKTAAMGYTDGTRLLGQTRSSFSVTISLMLRKYSTLRRSALYDALAGWAKAGYLEIDSRPDQRLYVEDITLPSLGSTSKWTGEIKIVLTAYAKPFWEGVYNAYASINTPAANATAKLYAPGTARRCPVDVSVTAQGAVNALTIRSPLSTVAFASLGLAQGETLVISHDDAGLISIKIGERSVLAKRTAASSDDLLAIPGAANDMAIAADAACTATFATRGRWM